jgi:opacity protein-like surface antigen
MSRKNLYYSACIGLSFLMNPTYAHTIPAAHPFYVGIMGGYGSTTWDRLVPNKDETSIAMSLSTPTSVNEGGAVWGLFTGYEFASFFAVEASYMRYPTAQVYFDETSLFTFENDGRTQFGTNTETTSLMAKFLITIPSTAVRAYSSVGAAGLHRQDSISDRWRISPTFGIGLNYNFTEHVMGEIGISYTDGYGQSELNPAVDYMPFLYAGVIRLAYRF